MFLTPLLLLQLFGKHPVRNRVGCIHFLTDASLTTKTSTTTASAFPKMKRSPIPPAFAPGNAGIHPPELLSSACSCLVSPVIKVRQIATRTAITTRNVSCQAGSVLSTVRLTFNSVDTPLHQAHDQNHPVYRSHDKNCCYPILSFQLDRPC